MNRSVRPRTKRPVRPHDAASLVLISSDKGRKYVLMGQRPGRMAFAPDVFVFPGGRLDTDDKTIRPATPLPAATRQRLSQSATPPSLATALAVAAIRETWEETGLMVSETGICQPDTTGSATHPWLSALRPDPGQFGILARAITPASSPIRFHARFFSMNVLTAAMELSPRSNGELLDLDWWPLEKARTLPMIDITAYILALVAQGHTGFASGPVPLCHYRNDRLLIRSNSSS